MCSGRRRLTDFGADAALPACWRRLAKRVKHITHKPASFTYWNTHCNSLRRQVILQQKQLSYRMCVGGASANAKRARNRKNGLTHGWSTKNAKQTTTNQNKQTKTNTGNNTNSKNAKRKQNRNENINKITHTSKSWNAARKRTNLQSPSDPRPQLLTNWFVSKPIIPRTNLRKHVMVESTSWFVDVEVWTHTVFRHDLHPHY